MSDTVVNAELYELPSSWRWEKLSNICDPINGRGFKKTEWQDRGLPIIRIQNLKDPNADFNYFDGDLADKHKVETGDLLFAWSGTPGTSFGAHIWRGQSAALNQHIFNIKFSPEDICPKYFCYALNQNITRYVAQAQGGVGLAHIKKGTFLNSSIPVAPRDQQDRIVAEIEKQFSRLNEAVAILKRVKANLRRYKAAVLKAAVEGKLTEEWRKQNPDVEPASKLLERILVEHRTKWEEAELAKMKAKGKEPTNDKWKEKYKEPLVSHDADLEKLTANLPASWAWASADQLTNMVTDGEHATPPRTDEGVYLLSARNVQDGWLSLEKVDYISLETHKKLQQRLKVLPGDVLLSCSGTVGRSCVVPADLEFSLVRSAAVLKPVLQMGQYMSYALRSLTLQGQINEKKSQTAQANIFQGKIKTLAFPLPPMAEQKELLDQVENTFLIISHVEKDVDGQLARAERCRQAILASMFSACDA